MSKKEKSRNWREYDKIKRRELFTPLPWYPCNWWRNIKWFFKSFKYAAQRVRRGYCDTDLWDIGYHITGLLAQALEDFSENLCGYPVEFEKYDSEDGTEGAEVWKEEILECSRNLFKSLEDLEQFNYRVPKFPDGDDSTEWEEYMKRTQEIAVDRNKCADEAFEWLSRYICDLWD